MTTHSWKDFASPIPIPGLSIANCRLRQQRLRAALKRDGMTAALIADHRHVHYLSNYWCRSLYCPLLLVEVDGPTTLSLPIPAPADELAVDAALVYESNRFCTLVEDQWSAALAPLENRLAPFPHLGADVPFVGATESKDIRPIFWELRRAKDADEVAMIRCSIEATEAAYRYASESLREGITEVELFAGMQAVIANAVGETVGEFGNDFQFGSPGGPPRRHTARAGEMAVLDLSVVVRGYTSDLCRSFPVTGTDSEAQRIARQRIAEVFLQLESKIRPGVSCRELFELATSQLDGFGDWQFNHHLGHGIGLSAHEAPRLNPHWDDTLEIGDVFTLEPGLYGDDLRAGLRIEQNYWLSGQGLVRLSEFPI